MRNFMAGLFVGVVIACLVGVILVGTVVSRMAKHSPEAGPPTTEGERERRVSVETISTAPKP